MQDFGDISTEVIIVNNSPRVCLSLSSFSRLGRLMKKFKDLKLVNSAYNWGPGIRYSIAAMAGYRTILFLDDDIYPVEGSVIPDMYRTFLELGEHDILTGWADLWVDWDETSLTTVSLGFSTEGIDRITEVDYAGTGLSMIDKRTLLQPEMLDFHPDFKFGDTGWFPWMPNIIHGSRKFYFPCAGRFSFHREKVKGMLSVRPNYEALIFNARRIMLEMGYQPVKKRLDGGIWQTGSPEEWAVTHLPHVTRPWEVVPW